jgi:hypothetical protein
MARVDDARHERKLLLDMRASDAWKIYEEVIRERIQLRTNDMIQPPTPDQAPNLKEFIAGEISGLVQAKDMLFERCVEELNDEIEQLGGSENEETGDGDGDGKGDGITADGDNPLGFGVERA